MLATPGALPTGPEWLYEVKLDGWRLLAEVTEGRLSLTTRTGRDVTAHFPELAGLAELVADVVLDGEVVMLAGGRPSFVALADRIHVPPMPGAPPATFMAFDVLRLYGVPLLDRPLAERRATLERLELDKVPAVQLSPIYTDGPALLDATRERGLEGVLAKRRDSVYRPGRRSPAWVKVPHHRTQAAIVAGWRPERATPSRIGSLLLGVPGGGTAAELADGLQFAGRVGAGAGGAATQRLLRAALTPLEVPDPPFVERLARPDVLGVTWCQPSLVVEVTHMGWTDGGRLRQPQLRGVRADLGPADVRRE